jgi:hypothetical protein
MIKKINKNQVAYQFALMFYLTSTLERIIRSLTFLAQSKRALNVISLTLAS